MRKTSYLRSKHKKCHNRRSNIEVIFDPNATVRVQSDILEHSNRNFMTMIEDMNKGKAIAAGRQASASQILNTVLRWMGL